MAETRHRTTIQVDVDDRSVRQLGTEIENAINPAHIDAFERAIERSNRAIERLTRATERMTRASQSLARASAGGGGGAGGGGRGGRYPGFANRTGATALGTALGHGITRAGAAAAGPFGGEGFLGQAMGVIPGVGPALSAAVSGAQRYYQQYIAVQQARMGSYGATGIGTPGRALAGQLGVLGYGPSAQPGVLSGLAQSSGRRGAGLQEIAGLGATHQRFLGVDSASILRGAETVSDVGDPTGLMNQAVAATRGMAFRDSELGTAIQGLSSIIGDLQTSGIFLDPQSLLGLYRSLGAARSAGGERLPGLTGASGASLASGIVSAGRNVGRGSSAYDYMMLQAAGGGRGGSRTLMEARRYGERHGGDVFFNMLENLLSRSHSAADRQEAAYFLADNMGLSSDLAMQLTSLNPDQIGRMRSAASNQNLGLDEMGTYLQQQIGGAMGPLGATAHEAGLEAQRVGAGSQVAGTMQRIQDAELQIVRRAMPMALGLVNGILDAAEEIVAAFRRGGLAEAFRVIASMTVNAGGAVAESAQGAASNHFLTTAEEAGAVFGADHPITQAYRAAGEALAPTASPSPSAASGAGQGGSGGSATAGGGGPGTEPGGIGPLSSAEGALIQAARHIREYRQGLGMSDADVEGIG